MRARAIKLSGTDECERPSVTRSHSSKHNMGGQLGPPSVLHTPTEIHSQDWTKPTCVIQLKAHIPFPECTAHSSVQINFYINPSFVLASIVEYFGKDCTVALVGDFCSFCNFLMHHSSSSVRLSLYMCHGTMARQKGTGWLEGTRAEQGRAMGRAMRTALMGESSWLW